MHQKNRFVNSVLILCISMIIGIPKLQAQEPSKKVPPNVRLTKVFDCNCSIRALSVNARQVFFAGTKGVYGYIQTDNDSLLYRGKIESRQGDLDFRALAQTAAKDYVLSAGNPALIYAVNKNGKQRQVYKQTEEGTFYDAMAFWNPAEGMAVGDPVENCMAFLITRDAGRHWKKIACDKLPKSEKGEAAFAASNSNIAIIGNQVWVLSGGKTSRVYHSADKGKSWQVYNTPLVGGKHTTGGYSIDFYDENIGVVFGGDYTDPSANTANKAMTTDGGKTWHLLAVNQAPGYKSCVRFFPKSNGKKLVAVGPSGISFSANAGKTWKQVSDKGFYTLRFLDSQTAYAAGKNGIFKIEFSTQK